MDSPLPPARRAELEEDIMIAPIIKPELPEGGRTAAGKAARSARLAAFAQEMNEREDDLRRVDLKSHGIAANEEKTQLTFKAQSMTRPEKSTLMSPMKGPKSQDQSEQNIPPIQEPKQHSGDRPASSSWDPVIIQKLVRIFH